MGSLCPSYADMRWADNSPYTPKHLRLENLGNSSRAIPKNRELFEIVYELDSKKLGFGHYGDVKKCVQRSTGTVRAVKVYNRERFGTDLLNEDDFLRQVEIIGKISHPCFIKFYEYFEDRDYFFLVMDYHSGGDLLQYLRVNKRLSEDFIRKVMRQILIGVTYMHKIKVVHRDLKPENILIQEKADQVLIKIINFDTVASFSGDGTISGLRGTLYYMAPEILEPKYNEQCDIWSIGITMFTLFTGHVPYTGMSDHKITSNIQKFNIDFDNSRLVSASESSKNLLKRMLCKDPKKRISAEEALSHKWFAQPLFSKETGKTLEKIVENDSKNFFAQEFLISNFCGLENFYEIDLAFIALDRDFDGVINTDDIYYFYSKVSGQDTAKEETESVINKINEKIHGGIDYKDFSSACVDLKGLLNGTRLENFLEGKGNEEFDLRIFCRQPTDLCKINEEFDAWPQYRHKTNFINN